eukprot:scaffold855_cov140-Skeletonema_menzelii.AAC.17
MEELRALQCASSLLSAHPSNCNLCSVAQFDNNSALVSEYVIAKRRVTSLVMKLHSSRRSRIQLSAISKRWLQLLLIT